MENVKLSPPWVTFMNEIKVLFEQDNEIKMKYDEDTYSLKLYVDNDRKAEALAQLLPKEKEFGNVKLTIAVVPANKERGIMDVFSEAFENNPVLTELYTAKTPFGDVHYVVFEKKVVQFFNDQMDDLHGNKSMLFEEIGRDVFGDDKGVYFCTDNGEEQDIKLGAPLGEWP